MARTVKTIPLTQGHVALVNNQDYAQLVCYRWRYFRRPAERTGYAVRTEHVPRKRTVYMHREIMHAPKGIEVDHRNHNGCDNQRRNLRLATKSQQHANRLKQQSSSRYKGVTWHKATEKWRAQIKVHGKKMHLGLFISERKAADAYQQAAKQYFGEFACAGVDQ